jgi:hypothetical protein
MVMSSDASQTDRLTSHRRRLSPEFLQQRGPMTFCSANAAIGPDLTVCVAHVVSEVEREWAIAPQKSAYDPKNGVIGRRT